MPQARHYSLTMAGGDFQATGEWMKKTRTWAAMGGHGLLLALLFLPALTAQAGETAPAVDAAQVFVRAAPSVLTLTVRDEQGKEIGVRTALSLGAGKAVSTCDGNVTSDTLALTAGGRSWAATVTAYDDERNLCLLASPGLDIAPLEIVAAPSPGTRVFAISNALGYGIGISEGTLAAVRKTRAGEYLQFSAPVSPGSQGGPLVDASGRLLGLIDYRQRDGQNVNFAIAAEALAKIEAHASEDAARRQFRDQAERLRRSSQWPQLAQVARDRLRVAANDGGAWAYLAVASQRSNDPDGEEKAWAELRRIEPDSVPVGMGLAQVWLRRGKAEEAGKLARALLAGRSEDAALWTLIGQIEMARNAQDRADQAFTRAIGIDPWQLEAHGGLIALAEARSDWANAAAAMRRLAMLAPDDQSLRHRLIWHYLRAEKPEAAYRLLESLPGDEKARPASLYWRGRVAMAMKRPLAAVALYRQSLDGGVEKPAEAWTALGWAYLDLGRFPEAIAAFRESLRLEPDDDQGLHGLAVALKDGGDPQGAVEINERRIARNSGNALAWRQLGFAQATLANPQKSIPALERSIELDPKQGKVWAALIGQYHLADRQDDLRKAYDKLRSIDGEFAARAYRSYLLPFESDKR